MALYKFEPYYNLGAQEAVDWLLENKRDEVDIDTYLGTGWVAIDGYYYYLKRDNSGFIDQSADILSKKMYKYGWRRELKPEEIQAWLRNPLRANYPWFEDWLQEIAQYSAQILLQELTPKQVARYMGSRSHTSKDKFFDWPSLSKDRIFDLVDLRIRAGTTGAPDGIESSEGWLNVLPVVNSLCIQMQNLQAQGMDYSHIRNLLQETLLRYDDRIDSNLFIPSIEKQIDVASNKHKDKYHANAESIRDSLGYGQNQLHKEVRHGARSKELSF